MNNILSFRFGTSKNKTVDHGVKETCAIMLTQVTYETVFYCNLKKKLEEIVKIRNAYIGNKYYYFDLPTIRVGRTRKTKKLNLPSPKNFFKI